MSTPHSWKDDDVAAALAALNAGAASFAGVQFAGWLSGRAPQVKVTVEDPTSGPTCYGVVSVGRVISTQELNGDAVAPFRDSEFLVEVYHSTGAVAQINAVFEAARTTLTGSLSSEYDVQGQMWMAPNEIIPPGTDSEFYSGLASVPYYAG